VVVGVLLGLATAAPPVECEPERARQIMTEARIEEDRIASSHPYLIPGLARASEHADDDLRASLQALCESGFALSYDRAESWQSALFSAHTILFTATEEQDCTLSQTTLAVTVGQEPDGAPRYALRGRLPATTTPVGDCEQVGTRREERLIQGDSAAERLVLIIDRNGDQITSSAMVLRSASAQGWREQVLETPAPPRYTGGFGGRHYALITLEDDDWVIASHDRTEDPDTCEPRPGQELWKRAPGSWVSVEGREALSALAQRGLWRHAGEDGWLLILAQDDPFQKDDVMARMRRIQRRDPRPLGILDSSDFPGLTAGYAIVTPAPFTTRAAAEAMRNTWGRRPTTYVKQAWKAADPCIAEIDAPLIPRD
jgi:hypothetical protein